MIPTKLKPAALALAAALTWPGPLAAENFTPEEVEVCPASAGVVDPEFDSTSQQMTYFDKTQNSIRVAAVTDDGQISPASCKGTSVASSATLSLGAFALKNGPEWGRSQRGLEIFYTTLGQDQQDYLTRATFDGIWKRQILQMGKYRGLPLATVDAGDPQPRILYAYQTPQGDYELRWRESTQTTEATFPAEIIGTTGSAPRWVLGQRAITTALADVSGTMQAVRYSIDDGTQEFLTSGGGNKSEVWMFPAPEFDDEPVFFTVVDDRTIQLYRNIQGVWTIFNTIDPSTFSAQPNIFSPEPFVYKQRTYLSLQLSTAKYDPSEVWIVAIDPSKPLVRQISDPTQADIVRSEPEWISTAKDAYVFFNHIEPGNKFSLWRAKTGL